MNKPKLYLLIGLIIAVIIIVVILYNNSKRNKTKKRLDQINIDFTEIKSAPIAFKLNKAQVIAKRNQNSAAQVAEYYTKYEKAQKHIDEIQEMINSLEDNIANGYTDNIKQEFSNVEDEIKVSKREILVINDFLENFDRDESEKREFSADLKEEFREIKLAVQQNANNFGIAFDGLNERILKCENLFSTSEEWMYANEYAKAGDTLDEIEEEISDLKIAINEIPELIKDTKGVLPNLIDEVSNQYNSLKQKTIYVDHLNVPDRLVKIGNSLNEDIKTLLSGQTNNVSEHANDNKEKLEALLSEIKRESDAYNHSKLGLANIQRIRDSIRQLSEYVTKAYEKEKERYSLNDLKTYLEDLAKKVKSFEKHHLRYSDELINGVRPATEIFEDINKLLNETEVEEKVLISYKNTIDETSSDEQRAISQVMKFQVVINEIEIKVKEYRLPAISENYYEDLSKSKVFVDKINKQLKAIPLDIKSLNETVNEAVNFIYTFYNNVNNIVGMAIMVENAIVFGNKYRSTYPEVDRELSKAEFSYLNGEFTKALTIAIACMETLFPNVNDKKLLENQ